MRYTINNKPIGKNQSVSIEFEDEVERKRYQDLKNSMTINDYPIEPYKPKKPRWKFWSK